MGYNTPYAAPDFGDVLTGKIFLEDNFPSQPLLSRLSHLLQNLPEHCIGILILLTQSTFKKMLINLMMTQWQKCFVFSLQYIYI